MRLSEHFSLEELTFSETAARLGVSNQPDKVQLANLSLLCGAILEPLRTKLDRPVVVTSGLRVAVVNLAAGGAKSSEHVDGRAADIRVPGLTPLQVCEAIRALNLPFNQLIHEFGSWCHVSVAAPGQSPKRECLTAIKRGGKTVYLPGLQRI